MNILRAIRTPVVQTRTYNRYTGGLERRSTLVHPPSRYGRAFTTEATQEEDKEVEKDEVDPRDLEDPEAAEALKEQQIQMLTEKISEMKANWQRSVAETDNLTKKMHKDVASARDQAAEKMIRQLFVVSDTLDFCLKNKPDFQSPEFQDNLEAKGAFDGLEASKKNFVSALKTANVTEIVPEVGDGFDPMLHNACFEVPTSEYVAPGQVGVVIKSGWVKEKTLLRAADVGVAKYDESSSSPHSDDGSAGSDGSTGSDGSY